MENNFFRNGEKHFRPNVYHRPLARHSAVAAETCSVGRKDYFLNFSDTLFVYYDCKFSNQNSGTDIFAVFSIGCGGTSRRMEMWKPKRRKKLVVALKPDKILIR
jgi:hypothetical protein